MQKLISNSFFCLLILVAIVPKAQSETINPESESKKAVSSPSIMQRITPFQLVSLAYQGNLNNHGIPSYGALITAYQSGRISAIDIVQLAVNSNRLTQDVLSDRGYLNAVEDELRSLSKG
ncbi:hypothetical protein NIES2119_13230 [[Phormidium ambiguum] IAM M-71]|uniref:Uncharacterized protein n=1 Tax=[Phormidium ambiguum] IAM M-71 TaxID=454136 RepID=A0A1U7IKI0_9CYAN|nr:hypothetical protein [Phormidium ambiguum]OKH37661.1 hypothetical protein NIES2119_13230 [Phormidium ambiguum IAM M-71]